jgi:hypothetical protein
MSSNTSKIRSKNSCGAGRFGAVLADIGYSCPI